MFIVVERWITRTVLGLIVVVILVAAFIWGSGGNGHAPGPAAEDAHWTTTSSGPADSEATPASASARPGAEGVAASAANDATVNGEEEADRAVAPAPAEADGIDPAGSSPASSNFFARYRLDRARTRSQQMELYTRMLTDAGVGAAVREEAQKELMVLAAQEEKETAVENLLRARGYEEALVVLDQRGATVVIPDEVMTEAKAAQIGELVQRLTGVPLDAISILPVGV